MSRDGIHGTNGVNHDEHEQGKADPMRTEVDFSKEAADAFVDNILADGLPPNGNLKGMSWQRTHLVMLAIIAKRLEPQEIEQRLQGYAATDTISVRGAREIRESIVDAGMVEVNRCEWTVGDDYESARDELWGIFEAMKRHAFLVEPARVEIKFNPSKLEVDAAHLSTLQLDAERYRWLRTNITRVFTHRDRKEFNVQITPFPGNAYDARPLDDDEAKAVDRAVDRAIEAAEEPQPEEPPAPVHCLLAGCDVIGKNGKAPSCNADNCPEAPI